MDSTFPNWKLKTMAGRKPLIYNETMKNQGRNRAYPVVQILKKTLLISVPVVIIFVIVSVFSFLEIRKQNNLAVENAVSIYQTELKERLDAIEHFVQWTVFHDPILNAFSIENHMGDYRTASTDLRLRVSDMQYSTGSEYMYFFYWDEGDLFINASDMAVTYDRYKTIRRRIISDVSLGLTTGGTSWVPTVIGGKTYLYYAITYAHKTFVSLVPIENLLSPLDSINFGKMGSIKFQNLKGDTYYKKGSDPSGILAYFYNSIYFRGEASGLPFTLVINSDMLGNYGKIFLLQFLVFLTALTLSFIMGGYILLTYKKVIVPIRIFSESLSKTDSLSGAEVTTLDLTDGKLQELNQINDQFKNLIHEITRLRINIYEAELDQNKFRILFLQQQIKPHFYLNCLTTIDSMLSLGDVSAAQKMLGFTSKYFRYLFQADKDFVTLSNEISHAEDYLDIQMMRLSEDIDYDCDIDDSHMDILIPPLLLITFIENIIKHADSKSDVLKITISSKDLEKGGNSYIAISIADNGQGFSDEVIEKIKNREDLTEDGSHIGITNCIRRLSLLYDGNFDLSIENSISGGAIVNLVLPKRYQ